MNEFTPYIDNLHVAKFGGSSMLEMEHVRDRMGELGERRLAVVSALGKSGDKSRGPHIEKITDQLIDYYRTGNSELLADIVARHRHEAVRLKIFKSDAELDKLMVEFVEDIFSARANKDQADTEIQGEIMAARLFAAYSGAEYIDPREVMIFDDAQEDGRQQIDLRATSELLRKKMNDTTKNYVLAGYGGSYKGETKLFSRSGTDVSAAVAAVVLGAAVYENFKEADGVFTADPRKVKNARLIEKMTYDEARDYGNAGAQVLHKDVISYLWDKNERTVFRDIDTRVRSVTSPGNPGTLVTDKRVPHDDESIIGVAVRDDFLYIKLHEYGMNDQTGYVRNVADFIAEYGVEAVAADKANESTRQKLGLGLEHMPTNTDSLTLIMRKEQFRQWSQQETDKKLPDFDDFIDGLNANFRNRVESHGEIGSVHLIGKQHASRKLGSITASALQALDTVNIAVRALDSPVDSTASVIFIESGRGPNTLRVVHDAFFGEKAA